MTPLVSVVCLDYEPDWKKLRATLHSIVVQEDIELEVIVSDDGSKDPKTEEIKAFFRSAGFTRYEIVTAEENTGTVKNVLRGLEKAHGKYVKLISPGDLLFDRKTLSDWSAFMEKERLRLSFSDAVYYVMESETAKILSAKGAPANKELYGENAKRNRVFTDYLVNGDTALGAAVFAERTLLREYLEQISGKVVFCEDYAIRLMVFDRIRVRRYPSFGIWYESEIGISSAKNNAWRERVSKDMAASDEVISEKTPGDAIARRYKRFLTIRSHSGKIRNKFLRTALFPSVRYYAWKKNRKKPVVPAADPALFAKMAGM